MFLKTLKTLIPFNNSESLFNKHSVYLLYKKRYKSYMCVKSRNDNMNDNMNDKSKNEVDDLTKNEVDDDLTKSNYYLRKKDLTNIIDEDENNHENNNDDINIDDEKKDNDDKKKYNDNEKKDKDKDNENKDDLTHIKYDDIDLMDCIDEDDQRILKNKRLFKMTPPDWGMSLGITNQYIQGSLLKLKYDTVYCDYDEIKNCGFDITSNIYGFDIIFKQNNKFYTVQSKLRQVRGIDSFSCCVNITTSRRRGNIKDVPYLKTDFDYLFVSLVNIKENTDNRKDVNKWDFSFIPVKKLIDPNNTDYLLKNVPTDILNEYKIDFKKKL